jgi:hypothetical protein
MHYELLTLESLLSDSENYQKDLLNLPLEADLQEKNESPTDEQKPPIAHPDVECCYTPATSPLFMNDYVFSVSDMEIQDVVQKPLDEKPQFSIQILEEIYKLRCEMKLFRVAVASAFSAMDYKKVKKNRTLKNRCTFMNRKGENCRGYICKVPGSQFCYAHHILSTAAQHPEKRKKLY